MQDFFTYAHSLSGLQKDDLLIAVGSTKLRLPKEMQVTKDKSDDVSSGPMKDVRQLMEFAFRMGQGLHGSSQSDASSSRTPVQPLLALENGSVDSKDIEHLVVLVISCFSIYLGRKIFCMYVYFERYSIVSLVQDTGDSQASALEHMDLKAKGADESPDPEALQVVPAAPDTSAKQSDTAPPAAAEPAPTAESQPVEPDAMSRLQVAMTQRKSLSVEPASKSAAWKRPAAGAKPTGSSLKRPASSVAVQKPSKKAAAKKTAKKLAVLKMTKKDVYSRAYHAEKSALSLRFRFSRVGSNQRPYFLGPRGS